MSPRSAAEPLVLMVSKPLVPPWSDSSKNLARHIVTHSRSTRYAVFSSTQGDFDPARVRVETPPGGTAGPGYTPTLVDNFRLFVRLLQKDADIDVYHFFFAPNPLTSYALKFLMRFKRQKTVHTLCSRPKDYTVIKRLMFADRVVALSDEALEKLAEAGVTNAVKIPPCVFLPEPAGTVSQWSHLKTRGGTLALYAGDYEHTGGHGLLLDALPRVLERCPNFRLVYACRRKTKKAGGIEAGVIRETERRGLRHAVHFLNEVDDMPSLIEACDFTVFPASSLYKKMDIPMVLLESLALERPIIVSGLGPLKELTPPDVGLTVQSLSADLWADAILRFCDDKTRRPFGQRARRWVEQNFSASVCASKHEQLYRSLASGAATDARAYYDDFSRSYEKDRRAGYHALIDDLEAGIVEEYARGKRALEVGCGTGLILERLRGQAAELTGVDISERMLDKARARGFSVRQGSATSLPFTDESFDVVYSFKVLAHVADIEKALAEMARVTKRNGYVIAEFYNARSIRGWRWGLRKFLAFGRKDAGVPDETRLFTRYDTPAKIRSYAPPGLRLIDRRGVIVWTPFGAAFKVPVLGKLLRFAETRSTHGALSRYGGFYTLVMQKDG